MARIYHITKQERWNDAVQQGSYRDPSLETEGFIHCSEAHQVEGVLGRYFKGHTGLLKLTIDTEKLHAPLQYDRAPSVDEDFPHVYGPINPDAVIEVQLIL